MKLTKRKDGRWQKKITLPNGKVKYFYSSESSEKRAEKDITNQIINLEKESHKSNHNFGSITQEMLSQKESEVSYATFQSYVYSSKHLQPLNDMDIEDITPSHISKLLNLMALQGYSRSAISKTKVTFGLIINYAIVYKELPIINFAKDIKLPKLKAKEKISAPDDKVVNTIIKSSQTANFGMWAMILLCTGMRRGELAALQKRDINFENCTIDIYRSVEFVHNQPNLKETPKSLSGIRTVPILDILKEPLYEMCKNMKPSEFIFGSEKPLSETIIKKRWKNCCKELAIDIHMHQLRHAYAKMLYRAGVDAKTAQGFLGHANISITMDIYTDFAEDVNLKAVKKIDTLISELYA